MAYCSSCGSWIPEGQGKCCSMCYGDPYYGKDGYYLDWLEQQERQAQEQRDIERQQEQEQDINP